VVAQIQDTESNLLDRLWIDFDQLFCGPLFSLGSFGNDRGICFTYYRRDEGVVRVLTCPRCGATYSGGLISILNRSSFLDHCYGCDLTTKKLAELEKQAH
jgi:hypothetical protein